MVRFNIVMDICRMQCKKDAFKILFDREPDIYVRGNLISKEGDIYFGGHNWTKVLYTESDEHGDIWHKVILENEEIMLSPGLNTEYEWR